MSATPSAASTAKPAGVLSLRRGEEPVVGQGLLSVAEDVVDEPLREVGLLGSGHDRDRIGRDDVHIVGDRDERDLVGELGRDVGDVPDPRVGLAGKNLRDDGLHVLLVGDHVRERRVRDPGVVEDLSGVVARGNALELIPREATRRGSPRRRAGGTVPRPRAGG